MYFYFRLRRHYADNTFGQGVFWIVDGIWSFISFFTIPVLSIATKFTTLYMKNIDGEHWICKGFWLILNGIHWILYGKKEDYFHQNDSRSPLLHQSGNLKMKTIRSIFKEPVSYFVSQIFCLQDSPDRVRVEREIFLIENTHFWTEKFKSHIYS